MPARSAYRVKSKGACGNTSLRSLFEGRDLEQNFTRSSKRIGACLHLYCSRVLGLLAVGWCLPGVALAWKRAGGVRLIFLKEEMRSSLESKPVADFEKEPPPKTEQRIGPEWSQRASLEDKQGAELLRIAKVLLPELGPNWNSHNLVTLKRQSLSRILYHDFLYRKIIEVPGVICEFGVQWGATLAQLVNLRGIYEPYNHSRKIYGFDTFEGFPSLDEKDGGFSEVGDYSTSDGYKDTLEEILSIHESFSPVPHIKKFELIKGDASATIDLWLEANPHAIISMALFDMDIYKPTRDVLERIIPRLTKGSVLAFDELNCGHFPGETAAVNEVLGLNNLSIRRHPHQTYCAWAVFGE